MDWKKFFDSIGLNGTRWQWRIMRWKQGWNDRMESFRDAKPQVSNKHKFCNKCGALLNRDDTECGRCEATAPNWHAQTAARTVSNMAPSHVSAAWVLNRIDCGDRGDADFLEH